MWFLASDAIIMIFATVEAVTCVRRNPETSSTDLRIVARSVHDCKKIVIYSEHRQKQIKFRHRIHLKLDVSFRFPLLLLHVLSALYSFSHWIWNIGNHCMQIFAILVQVFWGKNSFSFSLPVWTFALNFWEAIRIASPTYKRHKKAKIWAPNSHTSGVGFDWTYHFFFRSYKNFFRYYD